MIEWLLPGRERRLKRKFEQAAALAPEGPLRDYYAAGLPAFSLPVSGLEMMAIDLETDGLDFEQSAILEAGVVLTRINAIPAHGAHRIRTQRRC